MKPYRRNRCLNHNFPEVPDKQIHRVEQEQVADHRTVVVDGVKNSGHIHQQHGKHAPEILDVPEEHKQGRKDQAHANVEQHQKANGVEQAHQLPCKCDVIHYAEYKEYTQSQAKVDERLDVLREKKQVFWHIDLGKDPGVAHERGHALAGRLVEVRKYQITAEEVGGIVGGSPSKKLGEYQPHNQQGQQGGQYTPGHPQHCSLILFLEVPLN